MISQQVGPVVPVTIPEQGLLLDHLTRSDSVNTSEPPEQVNRPHDQPELKKGRQWSHNQNKEEMYCYYMAIKDKPRGYQKGMHLQWKDRRNIKCTEQQLCDQKKQIEGKTLLTPAEIEEVKQQVNIDPRDLSLSSLAELLIDDDDDNDDNDNDDRQFMIA